MWLPDIRTLFLILLLVNLMLSLLLFIFWKTQKTYNGFSVWMLSLLLVSGGYLLYISPRALFPLGTLGNLMIVIAVMLRLDSVWRFYRDRPLPRLVYGILVPAALLLIWFRFADESLIVRGAIIGALIVPSFIATALIALRVQDPATRSLRYMFAASLLVTGLLWTILVIRAAILPGDYSLDGPDPFNPVFFTVTILMDIVGTASFLMLNMARSQEDLRESELRYRNLADNLPDFVLIHDREVIRYANPAAALLAGPSRQTLAGQSIYTLLTPESAGALREAVGAARGGGGAAPLREIDLLLPDGTIRHGIIATVPIEDKGISAFLSVITDITERKAAEDALVRVNKKLTILSSITRHDIKNQITALSAYLELSRMATMDVLPASEYVQKEMRIAGILEEQIDFTRIYEDMGTTAPTWQNIGDRIARGVAALPMRDVTVEVDRRDLEIYADPLFERVLYNLMDNALKYGGSSMTAIRVTSREVSGGLVVTCEDNGEGIAHEDKARLFQRGFGKNTGLGLFLSREILSITGITIAETGEPGKGARFEMVVPMGAYRFTGGA
nr:ATP-binding protein [uncultured Methanoregula sp.]